jgi:hypothetical protein
MVLDHRQFMVIVGSHQDANVLDYLLKLDYFIMLCMMSLLVLVTFEATFSLNNILFVFLHYINKYCTKLELLFLPL